MSNRTALRLTPELLLRAYAAGIFPMADSAEGSELRWYDPPIRALIPLDERFHVPARLRRTLRRHPFTITTDCDFAATMRACAAPAPGREQTWINEDIHALYNALHRQGYAHSVEVWRDGALVGGLYGVALGGAFFGESMFSRASDASKTALVTLVDLLRRCGYQLLDTQFQTPHLAQFGAFEVARSAYRLLLDAALGMTPRPWCKPSDRADMSDSRQAGPAG